MMKFYLRLGCYFMENFGIKDHDLLIINKSFDFKNNKITVYKIDAEFTAIRIATEENNIWFITKNVNVLH